MNKQWMALLLSTGIAVTACPVPAAQMPPAEQIHGEAEETSVPVQHDDSDDRETANEFQSDTEPSQSETDDGSDITRIYFFSPFTSLPIAIL